MVGDGAEDGKDNNVVEKADNNIDDPVGELGVPEDVDDELMVKGVEGFPGIEEKDEVLLATVQAGVVILREDLDVGGANTAWDKTPLGSLDEVLEGRDKDVGGDTGNQAVVGVGNRDGAGGVDFKGVVLTDDEVASEVEVTGGEFAVA